jgi:arylsulfatase A-like enzyme
MVSRRDFIKKTAVSISTLAAPCLLAAGREQRKPNIILFISDDHGYADSGAYGDTYIKTPNIDRLARQSMRFTHAFAASPLCSPSRCVIETGLMPFRNGGHKFGTPIDGTVRTMPEYFKELGYYTAHIGKFHHAPRDKFPYDFVSGNENKASGFLDDYGEDKPLLLVVCSHPPHTPWTKNARYDPLKIKLPPNFVDTPETRIDRANYYTDVTLMDSILGRVLDAASNYTGSDNTLFVYTSDQGANWPFAKWCLYDAGLRVPLLVRWPGKVRAGAVTTAMADLSDLLPTFVEAAGARPPQDIDGRSFMPVLKGRTTNHRKVVFGTHTGNDNGGPGIANHCPARTIRTSTHRYILNLEPGRTFTTHISGCQPPSPHHLPFWDSWVQKAKTDARAKLLVDAYQHRPAEELYDLAKDPHEMNNVADDPKNRRLLEDLRKQLADWRKQQDDSVSAQASAPEQ